MTTPDVSADARAGLRAALDRLLDGLPPRQAAGAVERLMTGYRERGAPPVLRERADAVAYAAYRMPATFEAVAAALRQLAARLPAGWAPASHLDVGGGTGAAVWAAAHVWPDGARRTTVLDQSQPALALGRELAGGALPHVTWDRARLAAGGTPDLPPAGLVTVSYLLGELPEAARDALADAAARAGDAVVLVEPGTPDGHRRVLAARDRLTAAGLTVLAPCPHAGACPVAEGRDWCHFAARVGRSALHRRVKGGVLPYEDEKFSYVAAVRAAVRAPGPAGPAPARVVRRPQQRKGQVLLDLCGPGAGLTRATVTRRTPDAYRAARDAAWGDPWPAADGEG